MRFSSRGAIALAVSTAALFAVTASSLAQQQPPQRPGGPPQVAPIKPYTAVNITPPQPANDASFDAFRKQLGEAARKKDRAALAKLVVAQGFFWETGDADKADKKKSGIDNLEKAINLAGKEGFGWDTLTGAAEDPTLEPAPPSHKGAMCGPASPRFDEKQFEELMKATGTDGGDWGYPLSAGVEVRDGPQASGKVIDKLGVHLVRVLPDGQPAAPPAAGANQPAPTNPSIKVVLPSGKVGFVAMETISPLGMEQLCFIKDGGNWKITGFIGGEQQ
jgi:hypothetical protein